MNEFLQKWKGEINTRRRFKKKMFNFFVVTEELIINTSLSLVVWVYLIISYK